jgi:transglutaminase-like putative cysteine protease
MGIPARYVSGYLHVGETGDEPAQSHAWVEFWSASHGWMPFDPTHDRDVDERYVIVGHGRDYDDVTPNRGIYRGNATETLRAAVRTRATTERAWSAPAEIIQAIDVPVFKEAPTRRIDYDAVVIAEQAAQQQQ